jgi:hypothetical protein
MVDFANVSWESNLPEVNQDEIETALANADPARRRGACIVLARMETPPDAAVSLLRRVIVRDTDSTVKQAALQAGLRLAQDDEALRDSVARMLSLALRAEDQTLRDGFTSLATPGEAPIVLVDAVLLALGAEAGRESLLAYLEKQTDLLAVLRQARDQTQDAALRSTLADVIKKLSFAQLAEDKTGASSEAVADQPAQTLNPKQIEARQIAQEKLAQIETLGQMMADSDDPAEKLAVLHAILDLYDGKYMKTLYEPTAEILSSALLDPALRDEAMATFIDALEPYRMQKRSTTHMKGAVILALQSKTGGEDFVDYLRGRLDEPTKVFLRSVRDAYRDGLGVRMLKTLMAESSAPALEQAISVLQQDKPSVQDQQAAQAVLKDVDLEVIRAYPEIVQILQDAIMNETTYWTLRDQITGLLIDLKGASTLPFLFDAVVAERLWFDKVNIMLVKRRIKGRIDLRELRKQASPGLNKRIDDYIERMSRR